MTHIKHPIFSNVFLAFFVALPLTLVAILFAVYSPQSTQLSWQWVPSLGINFDIQLDGLSMLFATLICGIGTLIQLYTVSYMRGKSQRIRFHVFLTLFMLAMLGLVLSDNILLLFVFWELTTLTSYMLIGFNHEAEVSRKNALQAMLVTGSGGLALLAGLILLGEMAGTYQLSLILTQAEAITNHEWFIPSLILILLGAFTKSAQFPFHFWLPGAMAAPSPVSAYLHSATMVKAGIYLLARVSPLYSDETLWLYALGIAGAITAIWSGITALRQTDLKLMLAYSTNAALGKLTFLLALGTDYALTAVVLFILAHAFYKAALFMVIGNVDKATGTREYSQLAGLRSVLIISFIAALLTSFSKAGLPPLLGFLSKEYMYKAGLEWGWWAPTLLLIANAFMVTLALIIMIKPFLSAPDANAAKVKPIEKDMGLWLPPLLLAILSLVVPIALLPWAQATFITPTVLSIAPDSSVVTVKLWQGFNIPLLLSVVTLAVGSLIYAVYPRLSVTLNQMLSRLPSGPGVYQQAVAAVIAIGSWQTRVMQHKKLSLYVLSFFTVLAVLLLSQMLPLFSFDGFAQIETTYYQFALATVLCVAAFTCVLASSRLLAIAALGMVGFMTTLVFMIYSAPDVAKTQLLVEILVVVFLASVMRFLPRLEIISRHSLPRKLIHGAIASVIGVCLTVLLVTITQSPLPSELADFYAQNSVPGGYGRNIVNVILVDFRAFDTLGEVVVVVMAALATIRLIKLGKKEASA